MEHLSYVNSRWEAKYDKCNTASWTQLTKMVYYLLNIEPTTFLLSKLTVSLQKENSVMMKAFISCNMASIQAIVVNFIPIYFPLTVIIGKHHIRRYIFSSYSVQITVLGPFV